MHLLNIESWKSLYFVIVIGILLFLIPNNVQSQSLNLSGLIALDYHSTVTLSEIGNQDTTNRVSDFIQRYMISS